MYKNTLKTLTLDCFILNIGVKHSKQVKTGAKLCFEWGNLLLMRIY